MGILLACSFEAAREELPANQTGFSRLAKSRFGCFVSAAYEEQVETMRTSDYAARDRSGNVVFYVLLWKRKGISLELFDDYWRNVHGPVCARLPGQFQYWQLHVAHNEGGIWPEVPGISYAASEESNFDGIAELTFRSDQDRTTWFQAAGILMEDEHNLFSKAIGYNTSAGNSITYVDRIPAGDPNGALGIPKFHVMVKKADKISVEEF